MNIRHVILFVILAAIWTVIYLRTEQKVYVHCETSKGPLEIVVMPDWSPLGAARFLQMVDDGFFTGLPMFRCISHFICQFGAAPPRAQSVNYPLFADDPPRAELRQFQKAYLSFAGIGPNSRAKHIFIALEPAPMLGTQPWETPFGYVRRSSIKILDQLNTSYGDSPPAGNGPEPSKIEGPDGAAYLKQFPLLDSFVSCSRNHK